MSLDQMRILQQYLGCVSYAAGGVRVSGMNVYQRRTDNRFLHGDRDQGRYVGDLVRSSSRRRVGPVQSA